MHSHFPSGLIYSNAQQFNIANKNKDALVLVIQSDIYIYLALVFVQSINYIYLVQHQQRRYTIAFRKAVFI